MTERTRKEIFALPANSANNAERAVELQQGLDYLFCRECLQHVPCIRLGSGTWAVQCSRCAGECGLCSCGASGQCQGEHGETVETHLYVAGGERRNFTSDEEISHVR